MKGLHVKSKRAAGLALAAFVMSSFYGCMAGEDDEIPTADFQGRFGVIELIEGVPLEREFNADGHWELSYESAGDSAWCRVTPRWGNGGPGKIRFEAVPNGSVRERFVEMKFKDRNCTQRVRVHILKHATLVINDNRFLFPSKGGTYLARVRSEAGQVNVSPELESWCHITTAPNGDLTEYVLRADTAWDASGKSGWIAFSDGEMEDTIFVSQFPDKLDRVLTGRRGSLQEICGNHTLTKVIVSDYTFKDIMTNLSDDQVKMYQAFEKKGLGMVYLSPADSNPGTLYPHADNNVIRFLKVNYEPRTDIEWMSGTEVYRKGFCYFFDKGGKMVHVAPIQGGHGKGFSIAGEEDLLHAWLGEPDWSQSDFDYLFYTSKDYSRDGEVKVLQKATVGKGIRLVLVGDGFTDRDLNEGGLCETKLQDAMENIFRLEPMRSLRDRFNVYGIKTVSPNGTYEEGSVHCIDDDGTQVTRYTVNVEPANDQGDYVGVISNNDIPRNRSKCMIVNDESFLAVCKTNDLATVNHEIVGHGFGNLADTYTEDRYQNWHLPTEAAEFLQKCHKNGIYTNVSTTYDLGYVPWKHFIEDERYNSEKLGAYEGAYYYSYGAYRPVDTSIMDHGAKFCAPEREAIYKRVMQLSEGDGWKYDYETFVEFDAPARAAYSR